MKTPIYFIFASLISTGAIVMAIPSNSPYPMYAIALVAWAIFFWYYNRQLKNGTEIYFKPGVVEELVRTTVKEKASDF